MPLSCTSTRFRSTQKRVTVLYTSVLPGINLPEKVRQAEDLTANAQAVQQVLIGLGHTVQFLDFGHDIQHLVAKLREFAPDVVFNLAEAPLGCYDKEPHVAALLELLELPYTGNGPFALVACKNKALTKQMLLAEGIPTPRFCVHRSVPDDPPALSFPLVVKPMRQDGSLGITEQSVVETQTALQRAVAYVLDEHRQEAMVEEFLGGREFNVSVIGNGTRTQPYRVLPPAELVYHSPLWRVCTFDAKWDQAHPSYAAVEAVYPAQVSKVLGKQLQRLTLGCAAVFELQGYARVDFRLDHTGQPQVLDVNPNPDLAVGMGIARTAEISGVSYPQFLQEILTLGLTKGVR